jgi:hypothetical protein
LKTVTVEEQSRLNLRFGYDSPKPVVDFQQLVAAHPSALPLEEDSFMARQSRSAPKPEKVCLVCDRPFTWRKKWANCWDNVKYCSERCRRRASSAKSDAADSP